MKRPILVITLGFIIGNILGLYLNIALFIFLGLVLVILFFKILDFRSDNKYIRILNIFIKNNIILVFLISALISSLYLTYCNKRFEIVYSKFNVNQIIGTIISNNKETEYKNTYKVKVENLKGFKNINLILRVSKSKKITLNYGDKIKVSGEVMLSATEKSFNSILVLDGKGEINGQEANKGDSFFIPASFGEYKISGELEIIVTDII